MHEAPLSPLDPPSGLDSHRRLGFRIPRIARRFYGCLDSRRRAVGRGVGIPVPEPDLSVETDGSLRFPSHPRVPAPCSWTPVGPTRQAIAACRRGPRLCLQRRLPQDEYFGARSHGIGTHCLRFAGRVAPPPRKTRFRLLAKLCRAGFVNPQGCMKSFRVRVSSPFLELYLTL